MRGLTTESLSAGAAKSLRTQLDTLGAHIMSWLARWSITILRVGLGVIFLGFGVLKFFPGVSPAEGLVMRTLDVLAFGIIPAHTGVALVAGLECAIGLGLITGGSCLWRWRCWASRWSGRCRRSCSSPATSSAALTTRPPWRANTSSRTWCL